jgi:hypothetical protein
MKKTMPFIFVTILIVIIMPIVLYFCFSYGMIESGGKKTLNQDLVSKFIKNIKTNNKETMPQNIEAYYQMGKVYLNISFKNNMSLDESKGVLKRIKEVLLEDKLLENKYQVVDLYVSLESKKLQYKYYCPYYLHTVGNENESDDKLNQYRVWYLQNDHKEATLIEIQ